MSVKGCCGNEQPERLKRMRFGLFTENDFKRVKFIWELLQNDRIM